MDVSHSFGLKLPDEYPSLTRRETECLRMAAEGKSRWEIGILLKASQPAVVYHLKSAMRKLDARGLQDAINKALMMDLI
jgi:DNA-binding CsgD family transcriptional regulator